MVAWLLDQVPAGEIAVAIETSHGPVVEALMDRGVAIFAINPKRPLPRYLLAGWREG